MNLPRHLAFAVIAAFAASLPTTRVVAEVQFLYHFTGGADGRNPYKPLVPYQSDLVGLTRYFFDGTVFRIHPDGNGLQTLKTFSFNSDNSPSNLTVSESKIFGMVENVAFPDQGAAVFKIDPMNAEYARAHTFLGAGPFQGAVSSTSGMIVGALTQRENGTLFVLRPDGSGYRVVHEFALPLSSSLQKPVAYDNHIYGTTFARFGEPAILYRVGSDGQNFEVIHTFTNAASEGYYAGDIAVQGSRIYGAVSGGVNSELGTLSGSIYTVNTDGSGFEVLRSFPSGGGVGSVYLDRSKLYGTVHPGPPFGPPAVFEMNIDGTGYNILHDFGPDPNNSFGFITISVIDGQIFGTTSHGGQFNLGTIFTIPIPEPASLVLATAGIAVAVVAYCRGKKSRKS